MKLFCNLYYAAGTADKHFGNCFFRRVHNPCNSDCFAKLRLERIYASLETVPRRFSIGNLFIPDAFKLAPHLVDINIRFNAHSYLIRYLAVSAIRSESMLTSFSWPMRLHCSISLVSVRTLRVCFANSFQAPLLSGM